MQQLVCHGHWKDTCALGLGWDFQLWANTFELHVHVYAYSVFWYRLVYYLPAKQCGALSYSTSNPQSWHKVLTLMVCGAHSPCSCYHVHMRSLPFPMCGLLSIPFIHKQHYVYIFSVVNSKKKEVRNEI